jgi:hypothetical protein
MVLIVLARMLVASVESSDDSRHLFAIIGAKRGRPDNSPGADLQQEGGSALFVRGFEDVDNVVGPHGPVEICKLHPYFF